MRGAILCLTLWGSLLGGVVSPAGAEVTGEQVRVAIERSSAYLKRQQRSDGSWPDWTGNPGGVTALAALALLNAGVEPEDDSIQRALKHLRKLARQESDKTKKTYVVALATMVFCKASPKKDRVPIEQNVAWLEKTQIVDGKRRGSWSYPTGSGDPSNAQFALLALHEAERIGVNVSARTWRLARAYWVDHQNADGSWGYDPGGGGTGSMTCAGIASLVITSNMVRQSNARVDGDRIRCCVQDESGEDGIRRAFQWLGSSQVFAVGHNPGRTRGWWTLYYLYALERAGRLTARRFIGEHDWYREGAEKLLTMKGGETSDHWIGLGPCEGKSEQIATAFALLFLSKGRRPILLSKLKHGADDDWNQHQSDVANLTQHVESRWKRDMTWQVVDLEKATVEDLLESPVLYLCGRTNPLPRAAAAREELARKVRDYLDRGGFLFAEAYSNGTDFDRELRDFLDSHVFPEPEYRLAPLPPQHPVWRTEEAVDAKYVRPLWGIEFGCRTSVVYSPPDASGAGRPSLSCLWELSRSGRDAKFAPEVQARIDAGKSIGINVLAYATNRELKFKDPAKPKAAGGGADDPFPRGRLYVANLRHMGGCNAAPRALVTLLETAGRELKLRVGTQDRELSISDPALFDYHLVFMHGRNQFRLSDAERKQLRTYVERGGMLFANAICASRSFAEAFRREMETIFPERPLKPIPKDHPLFAPTKYGGYDLSTVTRRDPQGGDRDEPLEDVLRKVSPELEGIEVGDRYGVIFSRYDLSCALEKHDSLECRGYVREDAARIGINVLLYSLQQ